MDRQRRFCIALAVGFLLSICVCSVQAARQRALSDKLLRLHVIADSDSDRDQALKLLVRDAVLACAPDRHPTVAQLRRVRRAALTCLRENGCDDPVTVSVARTWFDTQEYPGFALPAGEYDALRVVIGSGQGHNWWCVVYPALCTSFAEGEAELTEDETLFISRGGEKYVIRFRLQEIISQLSKDLF